MIRAETKGTISEEQESSDDSTSKKKITRDEIIDVCNRLGLIEIHSPILLSDFRFWIFKNSIFSRQHKF